jgi:hypothetical protein
LCSIAGFTRGGQDRGIAVSIVSLLTFPDDPRAQAMFAFDHANEHNKLTFDMADPSLFNIANYLLDPAGTLTGAGNWALDHQQAHDDAALWFNVQPSLPLVDTQASAGSLQTWLFTNSTEHDQLSGAALAASQG